MRQYRITTTQIVTKISKLIEATNKEGAKNKWIEDGCPTNMVDMAGENWVVEEVKDKKSNDIQGDTYTTGVNKLPE